MKKDIDIHELMLTNDFTALNTEERAAVLAEMTAEEYAEQRAVLLAFGAMTAEETLPDPDAAILASLRARHDELHRFPNALEQFIALLTRPIPAYQLIIAPAVLVVVFLYFWPNTPTDGQQLTAESTTIKDTIEVIKEIPTMIEQVVYVDRLAANSVLLENTEEAAIAQSTTKQLPGEATLKRSYGNSGLNADLLQRLEAIAYREGI